MGRRLSPLLLFLLACALPAAALAQAPVEYRLSLPEPEHRWMQVDVTFRDVPDGPLELRMSRSSPGRYALHEFAKNVFELQATDASDAALAVTRPNPHQWNVAEHGGTVRVMYRIFGDRTDGTYLGIDSTHVHLNMPAAMLWARGFESRPVSVDFSAAVDRGWRVGTQLMPGADAATFTAPNLQYLMDSPTELSAFGLRTFTVPDAPRSPQFRLVLHHTGTDAELDAYARDVERIVREARHVFGEYPAFDANTYTFIADYLPWASGDGMEHRNSTILTSASSIQSNRLGLLETVSHEFFHAWNVERIRPASLEPFDFEQANMSGELWLAEGFTSYYGPLTLTRAGLFSLDDFLTEISGFINTVTVSPGRTLRSAVEMSRMAPFVDAATSIDRTNTENTFISYYTWGAAIGLGLDLALRDRTDGRVTLDDFMRALWQQYGKPGGREPGYVARPYTIDDVRETLAEVAGDRAFADDFFARYIQGHDLVDYERLLARAGLVLRPEAPGRGYAGAIPLQSAQGRARVSGPVPFGSPAYTAGLERDDVIVSIASRDVTSAGDVERAIAAGTPGESLPIVFERRGERVSASLRLVESPRLEVVSAERAGQRLTEAQRAFREAWLSSAAERVLNVASGGGARSW